MSGYSVPFFKNNITRIGFGCWQLAGAYTVNNKPNGYGAIDEEEAMGAIRFALENGINFFDTSAGYGNGLSEKILGKAIFESSFRQSGEIVICSKFGTIFSGDQIHEDFSPANLTATVEASIKRLKRECLDIILLHNPPDNFDFSKYDISPFEQLIRQGKIKTYGVSCRSIKGVQNVLNSGFGQVIEAVYNPLDRRLAEYFENLAYRAKYFICRAPLASGFLSARSLSGSTSFAKDDIRSMFDPEQVDWVKKSVKNLSFLNELEEGIVTSALRFQLTNSGNTIAIPGIKTIKQVETVLQALRLGPLSNATMNLIEKAVPEIYYKWRG